MVMKMIAGEKRIMPIVPVCGTNERKNRIVSQFIKGRNVKLFRAGTCGFISVPTTELTKGLRAVSFHKKKENGHITILTGEDLLRESRNGDKFFKMKTQDRNVLQSFEIGSLPPQPITKDDLINDFFGKLYVLDEHAGRSQEKYMRMKHR